MDGLPGLGPATPMPAAAGLQGLVAGNPQMAGAVAPPQPPWPIPPPPLPPMPWPPPPGSPDAPFNADMYSAGLDPNTSVQLANYFTNPAVNPLPMVQPPAPQVDQYGNPPGSPLILPTQGASGKTFDARRVAPGLGPVGGQQFAQPIKPTYFGM